MNVKLNDGSVRCAECLDSSQIDHSTFDACSYCGAVPVLTTPAVVEYEPTLVEVIGEDGDVVESYDMNASRARSAARSGRIRARLAAERASEAMCPQRPTQAQAWEAFAAMNRWKHAEGMRTRDAERAARIAKRETPRLESAVRDAAAWSARRERDNARNAARSAMSQLRKSLTL